MWTSSYFHEVTSLHPFSFLNDFSTCNNYDDDDTKIRRSHNGRFSRGEMRGTYHTFAIAMPL